MKKLFFIPAILFVLLFVILINSNSAASEETPQTNSTIGIFIMDEKGEYIQGFMSGCVGTLNFSTSTGLILNAGTLAHGVYPACVFGSGYYGTISNQTVSGSYTHVIYTVYPSAIGCICNVE